MLRYLPLAGVLAITLIGLTAMSVWPRPAEPVAALFLGADESALLRVAGAGSTVILGSGGLPGIIIAQSDTPDFAARLIAAGAVLAVRAPTLTACMSGD